MLTGTAVWGRRLRAPPDRPPRGRFGISRATCTTTNPNPKSRRDSKFPNLPARACPFATKEKEIKDTSNKTNATTAVTRFDLSCKRPNHLIPRSTDSRIRDPQCRLIALHGPGHGSNLQLPAPPVPVLTPGSPAPVVGQATSGPIPSFLR